VAPLASLGGWPGVIEPPMGGGSATPWQKKNKMMSFGHWGGRTTPHGQTLKKKI
jgi:hypothetical protein